MIILSKLSPACMIFIYIYIFFLSFTGPLTLTVDSDLHGPDVWAGDVVRGNAFIGSRLLFGDGFQLHVLPFRHKFVSACRKDTNNAK